MTLEDTQGRSGPVSLSAPRPALHPFRPADETPQLWRVSGSPVAWEKKMLFHSAVAFMKLLSRYLSLVLSYNWTKAVRAENAQTPLTVVVVSTQ